MEIRRAEAGDLEDVNKLLYQVAEVHHQGRPDLFIGGSKKYSDEEILRIFQNDKTPVFVAEENGSVLGYAFCVFQEAKGSHALCNIKTLYIDDLCVDEKARGQHIGRALYDYVLQFAKDSGCYNLTLNVWACNEVARRFYETCGLQPQKYGMECIL